MIINNLILWLFIIYFVPWFYGVSNASRRAKIEANVVLTSPPSNVKVPHTDKLPVIVWFAVKVFAEASVCLLS